MKDIIVIGAGASGLMASSVASRNGHNVLLLEKKKRLGTKLLITGKGRCNLTNNSDVETLINNTNTNPYFLYSAFYTFDSSSTIDYFTKLGLDIKTERGNRVYPKSDKSKDVVEAFANDLKKNKVEIKFNTSVKNLIIEDNKAIGILTTNNEKFFADKIILCTGGLSYPVTGSTGDGYYISKKVGHTVTALRPSLVALKASESWIKDVQGLSLRNVSINVFWTQNKNNPFKENIYNDFGEMIFTHNGISGPIILSASSLITKNLDKNIKVFIDLKPALSEIELDNRILKDFDKYKNKDFLNALSDLLPRSLIPVIIKLSAIPSHKKVNEITKTERKTIINLLKNLELNITDTEGYKEAIITSGGISVNEINPSTMESKIIKNLYFAGEVIDVDAYTGGFNLQIAFSTAYLAAINL